MTARSPEKSGVVTGVWNAVLGVAVVFAQISLRKITMADNTVNEGEAIKTAARSYNQDRGRVAVAVAALFREP